MEAEIVDFARHSTTSIAHPIFSLGKAISHERASQSILVAIMAGSVGLVLISAVPTAAAELMANGGFEAGLTGWTMTDGASAAGDEVEQIVVLEGTHSLQMNACGEDNYVYQRMSIPAGAVNGAGLAGIAQRAGLGWSISPA